MKVLDQIYNANKNICKNFKILSEKKDERGFFSENILNNIRNLLEGIFAFLYNEYCGNHNCNSGGTDNADYNTV